MHLPRQPDVAHVEALELPNQIRALAWLQGIRVADNVVAAHASAEIDDHVDTAAADSLDHLAIPVRMTAALASLGIAYVNVGHSSAGVGRLDYGLRNLLRRNRNRRMPATVSPAPVTAQVTMTSVFIASPPSIKISTHFPRSERPL